MAFNAKTDTPAAAVASGDKFVFGDVSADGWDTITAAKLIKALADVCDDLAALKATLGISATNLTTSTATTLTGILTGDGSTVAALAFPGGTTLYLRGDGTWSAAGGGSVASTDITDSTSVGRAVLTAANAAAARTAIGTAIGTDVQAYDADLTSWAAVGRASGYDTFAATPSSANLAALLTDETGGGAAVFGTSPTLTTPAVNGPITITVTSPAALIDTPGSGPKIDFPAAGTIDLYSSRTNATASWRAGSRAQSFWLGFQSLSGAAFTFNQSSSLASGVALLAAQLASTTVFRVWGDGAVTASGVVTVGTYTVATLPSASANAGALAQVTDSNSTTNGGVVAGGGANRVPVFSNGTNWIVK